MPFRSGNNPSQESSSSSLDGTLGLAARIVAAYVRNNPVPAADLVIRRYLEEGSKISREITARYAN